MGKDGELVKFLSANHEFDSNEALLSYTAPDAVEPIMVASQQVLIQSLTINNLWMMVCIALVFIMHLGFAGVESGFTQSKNTINILFKNTLTPAIGLITYALIGFNLMYPAFSAGPGWIDFSGFGLHDTLGVSYNANYTYWTDFLFQGMFAATAATIVSGAVAERIKVSGYFMFTIIYLALVYPIIGSWKWGGGALDAMGFYDFAGSTLVHAVGGCGALAGVLVLGPRIGKYRKGKVVAKEASSIPFATIGVFLLWLGWFGFNGGSVLSADPSLTSLVLVNTCLAAATGAISGFYTALIKFKRYDFSMVLNGILAGLVAITAGADLMGPIQSLLIGAMAGSLVVFATAWMDTLKLDDCVGAIPVHLVCGVFGTLIVGVVGSNASWSQFGVQLVGVLICCTAAFTAAFGIFKLIDVTVGLRVSAKEEIYGLDMMEHGVGK